MSEATSEWRAYAERLGFPKPEYAEKDYLQELLLYWLFSGKLATVLVFRGGTAISKLYGSGRFSEDLDFILSEETGEDAVKAAVNAAIKGIGLQYAASAVVKAYRNMLKYELKVKGPLYLTSHNPQATQTIGIDLNLFERPMLKVEQTLRRPIYTNIPNYLLNAPSAIELLADKVKAIMERSEPVARDLYDAWILSTKYKIRLDLGLVDKKMQAYGKNENERFSVEELRARIDAIRSVWANEMRLLLRNPPEYETVSKEFLKLIQ